MGDVEIQRPVELSHRPQDNVLLADLDGLVGIADTMVRVAQADEIE